MLDRLVLPVALWISCAGAPSTQGSLAVGSASIVWLDPGQGGKPVPVDVYYPAASPGGPGAPLAPGCFPAVAFGHGYQLSVDDYAYVWEALVPAGYVVALPRTAGELFPSHAAFALDLAFVLDRLQAEGGGARELAELVDHLDGKVPRRVLRSLPISRAACRARGSRGAAGCRRPWRGAPSRDRAEIEPRGMGRLAACRVRREVRLDVISRRLGLCLAPLRPVKGACGHASDMSWTCPGHASSAPSKAPAKATRISCSRAALYSDASA